MSKAQELAGLVNENAEVLSSAFGLDVDSLVDFGIAMADAERIVALVTEGNQIEDWEEDDPDDLFGFVFDDGSVIVGDWDDMSQSGGAVATGSSVEEALSNLA